MDQYLIVGVIWLIGWMFTVGAILAEEGLMNFAKAIMIVVSVFLWPLIIGFTLNTYLEELR